MKRDQTVRGHPGIFRDTRTGEYGFVVDVATAGGRRSQLKRRGFRTIKIAEAERARVLAEAAKGTFVRPSRSTVATFLRDEWLPARTSRSSPRRRCRTAR